MPLRSGSDAAGSQVIARLIERDCGFNDRLPGSGQATAAVMALIEEGPSSDTGGENPMATFDSGSRFCDAVPTTRSITSLLQPANNALLPLDRILVCLSAQSSGVDSPVRNRARHQSRKNKWGGRYD